MTVFTGTPHTTVIDLIARAYPTNKLPITKKQSPIALVNPSSSHKPSQGQNLHQAEQEPSFERTINLIRENYNSLKQLIQKQEPIKAIPIKAMPIKATQYFDAPV